MENRTQRGVEIKNEIDRLVREYLELDPGAPAGFVNQWVVVYSILQMEQSAHGHDLTTIGTMLPAPVPPLHHTLGLLEAASALARDKLVR